MVATTLRSWQHVRLRSAGCNVSGVDLKVDDEGFVIDETKLTAEAVRVMREHPNWLYTERNAQHVLRKRLLGLRSNVETKHRRVDERESLYNQAVEEYNQAVSEYTECEAALAQVSGDSPSAATTPSAVPAETPGLAESSPAAPASEPPPPGPTGSSKRPIPDSVREILAKPELIKEEAELRAIATSYGIQTTRKNRAKIEAEMKALVAAPATTEEPAK